ncbi:50S ribosomal protein L25/general stress protein Ctc [Bacillus niameyensis]|uniref:50S ribosomal protein L25/general stress protein Ctc n=1 Tax=Bacillus niameyensis TaxID=1522308 RepID=UPI00078162E8|nr:50S ribosomal protein L25/general stress protein Ctc [Bacillus niameyensis]
MSTVLAAKDREHGRRSLLNQIRNRGDIPGIVYGYQTTNTPIYVNGSEFIKTMREVGRNGVISLDLNGKKVNAILHEYQEDPIKNEVIHADFLAVDMKQEIEALVRVGLLGEDVNRGGGVVQQILYELSVTATPNKIPEAFEVDITNLEIGDSITIGDIRSNYDITINHDDIEAIVTVQPPRVEEEEPQTQENAEPDVIGKESNSNEE